MIENYELLIVFDSKLSEVDLGKIVDKIKLVIKNCGGDVVKFENQGRKRLSYPIKGREDGTLVFMETTLSNDKVSELDRNLKLIDLILRYSVIRKVEIKTEEIKK